MPEWPQPIESTDAPDDDNERPPDATAEQHWASFPTQPSTRHPRTGKPTSHYVEYVDLTGNTARFDLDRLKTWPRPGRDWWFGRGQRDDEILCRVIPAAGGAARWVLIYVTLEEGDESTFTLTELESFEWGKNPYGGGPTDRELTPGEAAEWLERNEYQLPNDLDLAPLFDPSTPPSGRLARDWRLEQAPDGGPPEPAREEWRPRVVLRGPGKHPLIDGREKEILTEAQYDVIKALWEAGESGLDKNRLIRNSRHGSAVNVLKRLARQDTDWKSAIVLPGKKGCRYRLASV